MSKRLVCAFVALILLVSVFVTTAAADYTNNSVKGTAIGVLGDSNQDNDVNIKDATLIQKSIADIVSLTETQKVLADVGKDGISITDVTWIQKYCAGYDCSHLGIGIPVFPDIESTTSSTSENTSAPTQATETTTDSTQFTTLVTQPSTDATQTTTTAPITSPTEPTKPDTDFTYSYYVSAVAAVSSIECYIDFDATKLQLTEIDCPNLDKNLGSLILKTDSKNGGIITYTAVYDIADFTTDKVLFVAKFKVLNKDYKLPSTRISEFCTTQDIWSNVITPYTFSEKINDKYISSGVIPDIDIPIT